MDEIRRKFKERLYAPPRENYPADVQHLLDQNEGLEKYVTIKHNLAQAMVIRDGLGKVDVEKYSDSRWNYRQMLAILKGLRQNIDITEFIDFDKDDLFILQMIEGRRKGLDDEQLRLMSEMRTWQMAREIRFGYENGIDASEYKGLRSYIQMRNKRKELEDAKDRREIN